MNPKALLLALLLPAVLRGQLGDRPEEGPQVPRTEAARHPAPSPALSADQELLTFKVPAGFRVELMAAEPLVEDPIAAAYDRQGNLWVLEFGNFNAGMARDASAPAAGAREPDVPAGRIVRLESSRHDGHLDRRVVWLDGLAGAKGFMIVRDGVLISDPPNIWLARDTHGGGHCDEKTLVLDTRGASKRPAEPTSLLWGRDNVIHDSGFPCDFRYVQGVVERVAVPARGQFGISQDDIGRLFFSRSTDHLRCDLYGAAYSLRNPNVPAVPWVDAPIAADQEVWPSHPSTVNRGYRIGIPGWHIDGVREDGTLLEFTAACSPLIYRGVNFPAGFYGNAFVPEPAANLIRRDLLLAARGRITAVNAYDGGEFLTSTDSRFRPVALLNAPDGSLVVTDMYRGILEDYHFMSTFLRDQSLARGLDRPAFGLGRLWKVTFQGGPVERRTPALDRMSGKELASLLVNPDGWWRDTAQQAIVERGDWSGVPPLEDLALHAKEAITRVCALWTLGGLEAATPELLRQALSDPSPRVRAAAVRLHERWLGGPTADAMVAQLSSVLHDAEPEVSAQLALTLGEAHTPASLEAMYQLLLAAGNSPDVPSALATGLGGREFAFFQRLAGQLSELGPRPEIVSMLTILSTAIVHGGSTDQVQRLIVCAGDDGNPKSCRMAILAGFEPLLLPEFRHSMDPARSPRPEILAPLLAGPDQDARLGALSLSEGLARAQESPRPAPAGPPLTEGGQQSYEEGRLAYQICAGCHQLSGTGRPGVAPSLVDSHWATTYPEIAIRIILCGKQGSPGFPASMPPMGGMLSDRQIAAVLTFSRNSWGLRMGAVGAATVAKVRAAVGLRQEAWSDAELRRAEDSAAADRKGFFPAD